MKYLKNRCAIVPETTMPASSTLPESGQLVSDDDWMEPLEEDDSDSESSLEIDTMRLFQGQRKLIPDLHEELPSQSLSIDLLDLTSADSDG